MTFARVVVCALTVCVASPALAHVGAHTNVGGFLLGFAHPLSGADHVLAMVAVGLWGAQLGAPAVFILPMAFPLTMAAGGFLGLIGVPFPGVEIGIALSAIALGLAVAAAFKPALWLAAVMVALFALCHGYAHGVELPAGSQAVAFSLGFVVATGLLHAAGILIGAIHRWFAGRVVIRGLGAFIAACGVYFLCLALT